MPDPIAGLRVVEELEGDEAAGGGGHERQRQQGGDDEREGDECRERRGRDEPRPVEPASTAVHHQITGLTTVNAVLWGWRVSRMDAAARFIPDDPNASERQPEER